jgi:Ca2+-transporting ATPase
MGWHVVWVGMLIGALGLGLGFAYITQGLAQWQTMIFTATAFMQVFHALAVRSTYESLFTIGVFSNRMMWVVIGIITVLQLAALYTPLATFLGLTALSLVDLLICVALGLVVFVAVELEKLVMRTGRRREAALAQG